MARFYVPNPQIEDDILIIRGRETRHIRRVLRLKEGDEILIFDGSGKEYRGIIINESSFTVSIKVKEEFFSKRESPLEITLAQSLLKCEKMDFIIQKATELGVKEIVPFFSSRSIPILEKSRGLKRYHRWERIAIEASKQCGRGFVPKVSPIKDYSDVLLLPSNESLRLILWEKEGKGLKDVFRSLRNVQRVFFMVGPEGGFDEKEIEDAVASGFTPVNLGERILRAETASLSVLSILQYEWGDMNKEKN